MAGDTGTAASDIVYDLVSIQYHALKGAQVYDQFLKDAQGNEDIEHFIRMIMDEDRARAQRCHELLKQVTGDTLDAYPSEDEKDGKSKSKDKDKDKARG